MKIDDLKSWSGGVAELLSAAEAIEGGAKSIPMTTFRFYQANGVVGRGTKEKGNRSIFGEREVLELVVARKLVGDGWPLAKLAQIVPGLPVEKLRDIASGIADGEVLADLQNAPEKNSAEALVMQFMASAVANPISSEASMFLGAPDLSTVQSSAMPAMQARGLAESYARKAPAYYYDRRTDDLVANERNSFSYGPGGWLCLTLDPIHPSFEETSETDAFKQLESAYKAAEQRLKALYINSKVKS